MHNVEESLRFQQEVFMVQNDFTVDVLNTNPKCLKSYKTVFYGNTQTAQH